jgi:hypothetical protein
MAHPNGKSDSIRIESSRWGASRSCRRVEEVEIGLAPARFTHKVGTMEADRRPGRIIRVGLTATTISGAGRSDAEHSTSVLELLGPLRCRALPALSRRAQELARSLPITPIFDALHEPFVGGVPDLLGLPATDCDLSFTDVVDRPRSMPERDIVQDVQSAACARRVRGPIRRLAGAAGESG